MEESMERELLRKLLGVASKLDSAYLTATTNNGQGSFTGEQYDELNDVMADVEEFLGIK